MIEPVCLPWNRRGKGHRKPVLELRVLAFYTYAQGMIIERLYPAELILAQIKPFGAAPLFFPLLVQSLQLLGIFTQAFNVGRQNPKRGRNDPRTGKPPNTVDIVMGC